MRHISIKKKIGGKRTTDSKICFPLYLHWARFFAKKGCVYNIQQLSLKDRIRVVKPQQTKTSNLISSVITLGSSSRSTRSSQLVKPQMSYKILVQQQAKMRGNTTYPLLPKKWVDHYLFTTRADIKAYTM